MRRNMRSKQDRREVESLGLPVVDRLAGVQQVHAADHVLDPAEPELGHNAAQVFRQEREEVDDVLGFAGELRTQARSCVAIPTGHVFR